MTTPLASVLLSDILHTAKQRDASDVHLVPTLPPFLRVDGQLEPCDGPGVPGEDLRVLADCFLGVEGRTTFEHCGDATVVVSAEDRPIRVHVSRIRDGVSLALRFLARRVPEVAALGVPASINHLIKRSSGLLIIGGPTGSGKSTTLASIVAAINAEMSRKIITIEDPVEYRLASIRSVIVQREVGRDVGSFSEAVSGSLRSDPDVIVIGEMRDSHTVAAAIAAAETGHLVLTTLHTADAPQAVDRLLDAFPAEHADYVRSRIAHVLLAVISQRLIPRAQTGGRVLAAEVLIVNDAVRHMIRDGKQHQLQSVMATGRRFGMQTLGAHLAELQAAGSIGQQQADGAI